jgi:hypothetical protein
LRALRAICVCDSLSGFCFPKTVYQPGYAVAHMRDVEIQEIAELESAETKITQELGPMDGQDRFDRLQLDNHRIVHKEIDSIAVLYHEIVVAQSNRNLLANT